MLDELSRLSVLNLAKRAHPLKGRLLRVLGSDRYNEIIYQNIVRDAARLLDFHYVPFPVKSAASYSFLYLLYRIVQETSVSKILELGVGESTLFLDSLRKRRPFALTSLEHDSVWCEALDEKVEHNIQHCPLKPRKVIGTEVLGYDFSQLGQEKFDVVIVDGPVGTPRKSRWGALELLESNLKDDFILLFDDAQRRAEQETILSAIDLLTSKRDDIYVGATFAAKAQALIVTGKYRALQFI